MTLAAMALDQLPLSSKNDVGEGRGEGEREGRVEKGEGGGGGGGGGGGRYVREDLPRSAEGPFESRWVARPLPPPWSDSSPIASSQTETHHQKERKSKEWNGTEGKKRKEKRKRKRKKRRKEIPVQGGRGQWQGGD